MPIFAKSSAELVYDLINESYPSLPVPISSVNAVVEAPTVFASTPPSFANTQARLRTLPNQPYIGNMEVQYRRIDFADLFNDVNIEIRKFTPTVAGTSPFTIYQLLNDINIRYGLSLTTTDVVDAPIPGVSDNYYPGVRTAKVTMTAAAGSLAFQGSVDVRWVFTEQSLDTLIVVQDLSGRLFPGGNDFSGSHVRIISSDAYGIDFSAIGPRFSLFTLFADNSTANPAGLQAARDALALINTVNGESAYNISAGNAAIDQNIWDATQVIVDLPNAAYPEANSHYYNKAMIFTLKAEHTWGAGRFILHYNV